MIKQFTSEEFCLQCQGCCRFSRQDSLWAPCLMDEEIQGLLDNKDIPAVSISSNKRIALIPHPRQQEFICALFDSQNNRCRIYAKRPFECQLYPFLICWHSNKVNLTVDLNCPFVKEKLNTKEFADYTNYLASLLNSPAQIRLLKENPQLIQAYDEVAQLVELDIH